MIIVRNVNTNVVIAVFSHRADAEAFLNIGNNRNIFVIEAGGSAPKYERQAQSLCLID
jgi:hypothetical protein